MGRGRAGEHPVLHPLPARLAVPTLSLWSSSELPRPMRDPGLGTAGLGADDNPPRGFGSPVFQLRKLKFRKEM